MRPWRQCGSLCPLSKVKIHIINHNIKMICQQKLTSKKNFVVKDFNSSATMTFGGF